MKSAQEGRLPSGKPTMVVLAAGAGSRFGGPKQLTPVGPCGETLLEYSLYDGMQAGMDRAVLVIRKEAEPAFAQQLEPAMRAGLSVRFAHQTLPGQETGRAKPWGTGHAVMAAEGAVEASFCTLNADDFYGRSAFRSIARFLTQSGPNELAAVGFPIAQTLSPEGPVTRALLEHDSGNRLTSLRELERVYEQGENAERSIVSEDNAGTLLTIPPETPVSMNLWAMPHSFFGWLQNGFNRFLDTNGGEQGSEYLLPEAIADAISEQDYSVEVLPGSGPWCGLTFAEDHPRLVGFLERLVGEGRYPSPLWGVLRFPSRKR